MTISWNPTLLRPRPPATFPYSRGHAEPALVPLFVVLPFVRKARPWAHEAHVAAQHIEQLGQLVQAGLPDEAADVRDPVLVDDLGRILAVADGERLPLIRSAYFSSRARLSAFSLSTFMERNL